MFSVGGEKKFFFVPFCAIRALAVKKSSPLCLANSISSLIIHIGAQKPEET